MVKCRERMSMRRSSKEANLTWLYEQEGEGQKMMSKKEVKVKRRTDHRPLKRGFGSLCE
jgi:hypothetical protein